MAFLNGGSIAIFPLDFFAGFASQWFVIPTFLCLGIFLLALYRCLATTSPILEAT